MDISVIYWKLNEIMAKKRIRNKDLAEALGVTENSIYRLRRTDEMPRLTSQRLNGICTFLQCQPGELLEWTIDEPLEIYQPGIKVRSEQEEKFVKRPPESEYDQCEESHRKLKAVSSFSAFLSLKSA